MSVKFLLKALGLFLVVAYPLLVYLGLQHASPRMLAAFLVALILLRGRLAKSAPLVVPKPLIARLVLVFAAVGGVLLCELIGGSGRLFLLLPLLINAILLVAFADTLVRPPSLVEQLARLRVPDLTGEHIRYCRRVTLLWCGFFIMNGTLSYAAAYHSLAAWTLYNGIISYLLIAALLLGETTYRYWRFRVYAGDVFDPFFRKLFPPRRGQHD